MINASKTFHHFILAIFFDAYDQLIPMHITTGVDLRETNITSLGNLESVGGNLNIKSTKITSLGNVVKIMGGLYLHGTNITSLGNVAYIGRTLSLGRLKITSLGELRHVGGNISLNDHVTLLGKLKQVDGIIYVRDVEQYKKLKAENNHHLMIRISNNY